MSASAANVVERIFDEMSYGPAPEDPKNAYAWLDEHDRKFGHFIDGKWHKPEGREYLFSKNPANGEKLAETIQGADEDVEYAVGCARKAFQTWGSLPNHIRARHIYSFARHVQKHQRLLSVIESLDNGKPIRETRDSDVPLIVRHLYHYAGWAQLKDVEMKNWKPIGVIGAIVPWNFPLMLMTWKIAPALAMGNTVVLKPASYTRLTALLLAEIAKEAGLPDGVLNVVTGNGRFGSKLAAHDEVDKVAFTGSTEVGQLLRRLTAGTGKKISLELGGKSPVVVFESADLDSAVEGIVDAIWFNQGQVCSAGSRIFVQETVYEKFVKRVKERLSHWRVGDSLDKAVDMGALVDESQLTTIRKYIQTAIDEGGEVFQPNIKLPEKGLFYPPTLITNVQTSSTVFLEEIFGPVAVMLPFRTAKEAVSLANNTKFGLAASVWTEKTSLNLEVALLIKAGAVWINCHNMFDAAAGFGGYRQSGYGRDGGKEGLYEYVKPSWETRCRPVVTEDLNEFGKPVPGLPKLPTTADSTQKTPKIDRTYKLFYNGSQKRPDGQYSRPVYTVNGQMIAQVSDSNRKDVREAVEAARKALPGWSKRAAHNRAQIIYYLAENLELRRNEFSEMLQQLTGVSEKDALLQVDKSIERLFYWSAYADKYGGTVQETLLYGATVKIHEPVGLIAISCPDEEPLLSFISLLAPAVVRGNAVVMATSDKFPIPAIDLVQVLETSDVPAGVVNVLTGNKDHITKYLAEHQNVEAMWYFGGALGSKFVEYESAVNLKRTWVNYGKERNWSNDDQGAGEEFLYHTTQVKNIWIPMGDIFAN